MADGFGAAETLSRELFWNFPQLVSSHEAAEFSFEQVVELQRSGAGLRKWLTKSGEYGEAGESFSLELHEGGRASGRVLARTKRETALGWDEIHGVLELKAFSMGPQKFLCVRGCGWGLSAEKAKELEGQMERAVERLANTLTKGRAGA